MEPPINPSFTANAPGDPEPARRIVNALIMAACFQLDSMLHFLEMADQHEGEQHDAASA